MGRHEANVDYILENYVGGSGRFQMWNMLFMGLVYYVGFYPLFLTVFVAYEPNHRCFVPDCEAISETNVRQDIYGESWLPFTIPPEEKSQNFLSEVNDFDGCSQFNRTQDGDSNDPATCSAKYFSSNDTMPCSKYIYDNTYFDETLVTHLDLVCDKKHLQNLLGTILILGLLVGSLVGGQIGDRFGRKLSCFGAVAIVIPTTIANGFVQSYIAYALLHFMSMACLPVIWINVIVYQTEIFSPKWRSIFVGIYELPFHYYIYCLIVYFNRTWTGIQIGVGIASATALPMWFLVPESPRWLAQNSKVEESFKVLEKISIGNNRPLTKSNAQEVKCILDIIASESHKTEDKLTPLDMFRKGHLAKSLILCFVWITACISFYALSLNSSDLSGHILLNFTLSVTASFGSALILLLSTNYFGRTRTLLCCHVTLGLACIGLSFIPKRYVTAILIVYILARVVASISFSLAYLVTSELYPTNLRSQAVGSASTIARVFCACAPFLKPLAEIWQPLPMLIIGVPIIISGILVHFLPETHDVELPQTMKNAENIHNTD